MLKFLLIIHVIITLLLILTILLQKNSGDGLSGIGGGGGLNNIISGRASANLLTKLTAIFATIFIINSLVLANLSGKESRNRHNLIEKIEQNNILIE